jgi:hypothetical protein
MNSFHKHLDNERTAATADATRIADQHVSQGRKLSREHVRELATSMWQSWGGGLSHASHRAYTETFVTVLNTRYLAGELAQAHGVSVESILRAAVMDFAHGRDHYRQSQALRTVTELDASHGDKKRHSSPTG